MECPLSYPCGIVWASLGWLRNSCGLLSSFQISIPTQDKLGVSCSTPRWLLNSTRQSRKFPVWLLVQSSIGSLLLGSVQFSSCLCHIVCVVLVAHNFTELNSGRTDYSYLALGQLSRFVYCLLQKVKRSSDLPKIEKREACLIPNLSCLRAIAEEHFLEGDPSVIVPWEDQQ